jgi:hypothetical protein
MKLPGQALQLVESCMLTILSHGSLYDRARLLYVYAKCQVAESHKSHTEKRKGGEHVILEIAVCLDKFCDVSFH